MAKIDQMKNIAFLTFNFLICQTIPKKISSRQRCTDCDFATICRSLQYTGAAQLHFSICSFLSRLQRPLDNPAVHSYAYLPRNGRVWKSRMGNMHVQCIRIRRIFMFKVYVLQSETWETVQCTAFSVVCSMCAPIWQTTLLPTKNGKKWFKLRKNKSLLPQVKNHAGITCMPCDWGGEWEVDLITVEEKPNQCSVPPLDPCRDNHPKTCIQTSPEPSKLVNTLLLELPCPFVGSVSHDFYSILRNYVDAAI